MTTEQEINKQIQADYDIYRTKIYDGALPIHDDLLKLFQKALMAIPYDQHNMNMVRVREILDKNVSELTWLEVGMVNNLLHRAAPEKLFSSPYRYCEFMIANCQFVIEYNSATEEWNRKIEAKKKVLTNTSGIIRSNKPVSSGGKLIVK